MEVCACGAYAPDTVLLKLNGTKCNLRCAYCSEIDKSRQGSLSLDSVKKVFCSLSSDADVILHGGEPLLDWKLAKDVIDLHYELRDKRIGIQTNGCCSAEVLDMLGAVADKIKLGVSVDGPEHCNVYRKTKMGGPVFADVVQFLEYAGDVGIPVKCISTINNVNVLCPTEVLDFFASQCAVTSLRVNPCFDVCGNVIAEYAVHPLAFLGFLKSATRYWFNSRYFRKFKLEPILSAVQAQGSIEEVNRNLPCTKYVSFYPSNVCTLCDVLGNDPVERDVGNLFAVRDGDIQSSECSSCGNRARCSGCPGILRRFAANRDLKGEYCEYRMGYFEFIAQLKATLHFENG